jgi:hypothetical protein
VCIAFSLAQAVACAEEELGAFEVLVRELDGANGAIESHRVTYTAVVRALRGMLSTVEPYERPLKSREMHPFVQRDFPEIRRDKFEPGQILDKYEFAQRAIERVNPLVQADAHASAALDADLKIAIDTVAAEGAGIVAKRRKRMAELRRLASALEPLRATLDGMKCEQAAAIAADFNVAWASALIDSMRSPDVRMPYLYVTGFPVVFDIADSGLFKADEQPAEISQRDFEAGNTRMISTIEDEITKSATTGTDEQRERRKQCWIRTQEELDEGLIFGPYSRAQLDRWYGRGKWRCLGRNAILQKAKWRCIDNGKRSKHNKAASMHERLTCGRADFPVLVAREFAKRWAAARRRRCERHGWINLKPNSKLRRSPADHTSERLQHGTNDLRAAYRHVPTSQPQYTVAAVWQPDETGGRVSYVLVPGHNFGLKAAPVSFNRCPEIATAAARRLLWIVNEHFYDDSDTTEPSYAERSGQTMLVELSSSAFLGFPFDPRKDVLMESTNEYLGVESGFDRMHEGVLTMEVSAKRRGKIADLVKQILTAKSLRSGIAASLFGKTRFMLSPCYGSLGKACLQPIMQRSHQPSANAITADIADALEFIEFVAGSLPALEIPLVPSEDRRKVVIFTDAEGKKRKGRRPPTGHLGFVVYHPVHGTRHAYATVPDSVAELFDTFRKRDTYIGQYEIMAAITPFISLPRSWFEDRPIELWIDNAGAVGALIKGYSGVPDCARLVNMFHFAISRLGAASLWIDYVPSESNPADIPSRFHEMDDAARGAAAAQLGDLVRMVVPELSDSHGVWLSSTSIALSVWRS